MGEWLKTYDETIYGTRKSFMKPAEWGVAVEKESKIYLHITNPELLSGKLEIPDFPFHPEKVTSFETKQQLDFRVNGQKLLTVKLPDLKKDAIDQVVVVAFQK